MDKQNKRAILLETWGRGWRVYFTPQRTQPFSIWSGPDALAFFGSIIDLTKYMQERHEAMAR